MILNLVYLSIANKRSLNLRKWTSNSEPHSKRKKNSMIYNFTYCNRFESDLRNKIVQKCPPTGDEKTFLTKTFKFFDI